MLSILDSILALEAFPVESDVPVCGIIDQLQQTRYNSV